jgi:hypothetical protein
VLLFHVSIIESLKNYTSCTIWLKGFKTKNTMEVYAIHLLLFCRFCALTPDQLIDLKKVAKQSACKPKPGSLSVNSIKHWHTVLSWFSRDYSTLEEDSKILSRRCYNTFRGYTREEIAKLLSLADLRDRSIILLNDFKRD